ncbi:MAG: hypothetical protein AAGF12_14710 [Myxococcota bacterium]
MVNALRGLILALLLGLCFTACGRGTARIVARDTAGGVLELNGRYSKARRRAERMMADYCNGAYTVLNDHELGPTPPRSVRGHMLQYQCGAAQVVHVQDPNATVYIQQGGQPVPAQPTQGGYTSPSGASPSGASPSAGY